MKLRALIFVLPLFFCSNLQAATASNFPTFGLSYTTPKDAASHFGLARNVIGRYVFDKASPFAGAEISVKIDPALNGRKLADLAKALDDQPGTTTGTEDASVGGEKALRITRTTPQTPPRKNIIYLVSHENRVYWFISTSPDGMDVSVPVGELAASANFIPVESLDKHVNEFSRASLSMFGLCSLSGPRTLRVRSQERDMVDLRVSDFTTDRDPFTVTLVRIHSPTRRTFADVREKMSTALASALGMSEPLLWDDRSDLPALHVSHVIKRTFPLKNGGTYIGYARYCILELGQGNFVQITLAGVVTPEAVPDYVAATDRLVASIKVLPPQSAAVDPNAR